LDYFIITIGITDREAHPVVILARKFAGAYLADYALAVFQ